MQGAAIAVSDKMGIKWRISIYKPFHLRGCLSLPKLELDEEYTTTTKMILMVSSISSEMAHGKMYMREIPWHENSRTNFYITFFFGPRIQLF